MKSDIETTAREEEVKLEQMIRELGAFLDSLRTLQKQIVRYLSEIEAKGKKLSRDIEQSMKGISIHEQGRPMIGKAVSDLEGLSFGLVSTIPALELERMTDGMAEAEGIAQFSRKELLLFLRGQLASSTGRDADEEKKAAKGDSAGDVEMF